MSNRQQYYRNRHNRPFLNLERLEDRTVPAYSATLSGVTATFVGNSSGGSGDIVVFGQSGGLLMHNRGIVDAGFNSAFDFNSTVAGDQTLAASAASIINLTTGNGPDLIEIGGQVSSAFQTVAASTLLADFNLTKSGAANVEVVVDDSPSSTGKAFTFASNGVTATGINVSFGGPAFGGGIELKTGSGNDTVNLTSVLGIANGVELRRVTNAGGNDTVTIGSAAGSLDGFAGQPITVIGDAGTTAVTVNDSGDAGGDTYNINATDVRREDGANDVVIIPSGVGVSISLNSGGGNDTFNVAPRSNQAINIDGGGGTNSLVIDLAGTTNPVHTPISATSGHTTYDNRADVDYQNIQNFSSINGTFGSSNPGPSSLSIFIGANFNENESTGIIGSFTNPDGEAHTVTIDFGDGTTPLVLNLLPGESGFQANHVYLDDDPSGTVADSKTVTVTVSDGISSVTATRSTLIHNVAPSNVSVSATPTTAGSTSTITVNFTDPGTLDPHLIDIDFGDGSPVQSFGVAPGQSIFNKTHVYANQGTFTITATVHDDDLGTAPAVQSTVVVVEPAPVVTPPTNQTGSEGGISSFALGSFTDANSSGNYTVTVNWGDGTPNTVFNQAAVGTITGQNHRYTQDGSFPVTVTVSDGDGTSTPVGFQANISNVLPVAVDAPDQNGVATIAKSFALGSFTDPGADAPWHITVQWGDGSPNGSFTVNTPGELPPLTHAFANAGQFNVVVTVQDDDGSATSDYLVNVIPPIAHVTGNVFRDFNNNGLLNGPDVGFADVTVFADRDGDSELDANEPFVITDSNGDYQLDVGFEGAVSVRQVTPAGFNQTTANPADVNVQFGDTVSVDSLGDNRIITPTIAVAGRLKALPFVQVRNADGTLRFSFTPFTKPATLKEVRLATGDVNDDGIEDIFVVPGPGASSLVKVFDGADGHLISSFTAFAATFSGGVSIAAGDVNGDGVADIVVGTEKGAGPLVKIFDGSDNQLIRSVVPTNANLYTGVKVALGDVDGDGVVDVITSPGTSTESVQYRIRAQDALTGASLLNFLVKPVNHGVATLNVTAGDLDHDGRAEILLATSRNGQTLMRTFKNGIITQAGLPFAANLQSTAFSVAAKDLTGDGIADLLFAGSTGLSPRLKLVDSATGQALFSALLLGDKDRNGLIVG